MLGAGEYTPIGLCELLAGPRKVDWVVQGIMPPRGITIVAGASGAGKSWLSQDLALSIATGTPWLGRFATKQGHVLVVDEENDHVLLTQRMGKLIEGRKANGQSVDERKIDRDLEYLIGEAVSINSTCDPVTGEVCPCVRFERLHRTVERFKPSVVVFDSLSRIHSADEYRASQEMSLVFSGLKQFAKETGVTVVVLHHVRKGSRGNADPLDAIRGSTDIGAACDTALLVEQVPGCGCTVAMVKSRWAAPIEPFTVNFRDDSSDEEAEEGLGRFYLTYDSTAGPLPSGKKISAQAAGRTAVLEALHEHGGRMRRRDLETAVVESRSCGSRVFGKVVTDLVASDDIHREKADGNEVYFVLAEKSGKIIQFP